MLSWFIYLWSLHKEIINPCNDTCSSAVIIDGHQKCRRRVCKNKDVEFETDEFDKLVISCCRSPLHKSYYCLLHCNENEPIETLTSTHKSYKTFLQRKKNNKQDW